MSNILILNLELINKIAVEFNQYKTFPFLGLDLLSYREFEFVPSPLAWSLSLCVGDGLTHPPPPTYRGKGVTAHVKINCVGAESF